MARDYNFWVYIITNRNQSVLYIGVTNRLSRRTYEHRVLRPREAAEHDTPDLHA